MNRIVRGRDRLRNERGSQDRMGTRLRKHAPLIRSNIMANKNIRIEGGDVSQRREQVQSRAI
jgi:hypothetical protein